MNMLTMGDKVVESDLCGIASTLSLRSRKTASSKEREAASVGGMTGKQLNTPAHYSRIKYSSTCNLVR